MLKDPCKLHLRYGPKHIFVCKTLNDAEELGRTLDVAEVTNSDAKTHGQKFDGRTKPLVAIECLNFTPKV